VFADHNRSKLKTNPSLTLYSVQSLGGPVLGSTTNSKTETGKRVGLVLRPQACRFAVSRWVNWINLCDIITGMICFMGARIGCESVLPIWNFYSDCMDPSFVFKAVPSFTSTSAPRLVETHNPDRPSPRTPWSIHSPP
jgi:hypothetical protein